VTRKGGFMFDGFVKYPEGHASPDAVYHLQVTLRFIPRHCGLFRGHVPIPLGFRNMSPTPHSSGPGAQTGSPACGATGRKKEQGFPSLPGLAARRAASPSRALPAAFLRSRPIYETFKTFTRASFLTDGETRRGRGYTSSACPRHAVGGGGGIVLGVTELESDVAVCRQPLCPQTLDRPGDAVFENRVGGELEDGDARQAVPGQARLRPQLARVCL
jgi:hypothetical protein